MGKSSILRLSLPVLGCLYIIVAAALSPVYGKPFCDKELVCLQLKRKRTSGGSGDSPVGTTVKYTATQRSRKISLARERVQSSRENNYDGFHACYAMYLMFSIPLFYVVVVR